MIKIFTVPFSKPHGTFFEDDLNRFLLNKKVKSLKAEFFNSHENFYWTIFIDYDPVIHEKGSISKEKENIRVKLEEKDELLLKRLKEWRKEKAEKEGIPVYIIATNEQLMQIIRTKPKSQEALKQIKGFGKKKIERYGHDFLKIMGDFLQ